METYRDSVQYQKLRPRRGRSFHVPRYVTCRPLVLRLRGNHRSTWMVLIWLACRAIPTCLSLASSSVLVDTCPIRACSMSTSIFMRVGSFTCLRAVFMVVPGLGVLVFSTVLDSLVVLSPARVLLIPYVTLDVVRAVVLSGNVLIIILSSKVHMQVCVLSATGLCVILHRSCSLVVIPSKSGSTEGLEVDFK